ncbi:ATP-binding protein, partial [Streptomyces sp. NPDC001978]
VQEPQGRPTHLHGHPQHQHLDADDQSVTSRPCPKDWAAFQRHTVEFHLRNAAAWANDATGHDLATQVDPDFQHGPAALAAHA